MHRTVLLSRPSLRLASPASSPIIGYPCCSSFTSKRYRRNEPKRGSGPRVPRTIGMYDSNGKQKDGLQYPIFGGGVDLDHKKYMNIYNKSRKNPRDDSIEINSLFRPVQVNPEESSENVSGVNLGEEIAGILNKQDLLRMLNRLSTKEVIIQLSKEHGLNDHFYNQSFISFRKCCLEVKHLPTDLYVLFCDVLNGARSEDEIFPYFLQHAHKVYPHLSCLDELRHVSNLSDPTDSYPEARSMNRKVIFHAGPTNSGKTYHAIERFRSAKSGVYCGPLKLLAVEVFNKTNAKDVPCDLVTGEERRYAREDNEPSEHVCCTIEMTNCSRTYEVAVIDEIQMVKDICRGWAWTRALLGVPAEEIHLCGEAAAIDLVREILISTGEDVEVRNYKRLTPMVIEEEAVNTFNNVQPGDCIVCFNKQDIYTVSRGLERRGVECAVIYGSLPPGTKMAMSDKFNDPEDPCKVLVATDAVGMGLNLNIRRMIFYSMSKIHLLESGEKSVDIISVSQALQIAGRAGRFGTKWDTGFVTCFNQEDIPIMKELLSQKPPEILHAGLHPTFEMMELYSYHLPQASLSNLIDIFYSLSTINDSLYKLSNMDDFKFLADMIEHVKIPLKARYTFCNAPINLRQPFVCTLFLKVTRQYSKGELITFDWLCQQIGWPFRPPVTILDLIHLEAVHDVFDLYLWLSNRFEDMFPDVELIFSVREELDLLIQEGIADIVRLLKNTETGVNPSLPFTFEPDQKSGGLVAHQRVGALPDDDEAAPKDFNSLVNRLRKKKPEIELDRSSKTDLSGFKLKTIKRSVSAEDKIIPGKPDSEEDLNATQAFQKALKNKVNQGVGGGVKGAGRLSDRLINEGFITKQMMKSLEREFAKKYQQQSGLDKRKSSKPKKGDDQKE